jgi:hypothetical protein
MELPKNVVAVVVTTTELENRRLAQPPLQPLANSTEQEMVVHGLTTSFGY